MIDRTTLHPGDCMDVLATLDENSIDACVTDPPYHLTSIVKRFGAENAAPAQFGKDGVYARSSTGFMGKQWDGGDVAFRPETWAAVYRVLKPGAHLVAFGGTRTYHRMACAIEDAGFEVRDCIMWLYGSGFPKSHDVSKGIDRAAGVERKVIGLSPIHSRGKATSFPKRSGETYCEEGNRIAPQTSDRATLTAPATDAARQWQGWGTALKPACELIVLARKPLSEKTVAANVLRWGTGAINVDSCRIESKDPIQSAASITGFGEHNNYELGKGREYQTQGRWPANVIHDGSPEVVEGFPDGRSAYGNQESADAIKGKPYDAVNYIYGESNERVTGQSFSDSGSAARFFYTSKADSDDRLGSKHPTVKPLDLMQYLCRLVCPKGGTVLDPFSGTGTTGEAAWREGMRAVLIEADAGYQADIRRRVELLMAGPDERLWAGVKERQKDKPRDDGPLFGGKSDWEEMWKKPFGRPELL